MAKTKISEFSSTPANNTDIDSINIAEGCAPSNINDAIRELMAQLKDFQTGAVGDSFNGPIGSSTASTGAFTNITASGTLGVTGVATLGAGAILNTPASVTLTNATGLPISTGVSGLGTGVATALAVNVGSAGAPVVNGGALGTPSSGTVTNLTGTASININGTVGATTPTTGAFTTVAASSSVTLSGGTANGVTYLNGSKVLTSGSALTFDGTTLTATQSTAANISLNNSNGNYLYLTAAGGAAFIDNRVTGSINFRSNGTFNWSTYGGSDQMSLTSTGLGIGTSSPYTKLDVSGSAGMKVYYTGGTDLNSAGSIALGDGNRSANYVGLYRGTSISTGTASNALTLGAYDYIGFNVSATTLGSQTERMRLDSSGNLGLGVAPSDTIGYGRTLDIGSSSGGVIYLRDTDAPTTQYAFIAYDGNDNGLKIQNQNSSGFVRFGAGGAERARIDSSGNLLVGTTSQVLSAKISLETSGSRGYGFNDSSGSAGTKACIFGSLGTEVGHIAVTTTSTTYATSSDYRLKNTIAPMVGALAKVALLKPVTYKWNADGSDGEGFIAHELAEVCPHAVTGEKDAVDENGNPKYQGIDTSFLVATLTAAIQELKAEFDAYKASHP